jgi:hypothetical protein
VPPSLKVVDVALFYGERLGWDAALAAELGDLERLLHRR